MKDILFQKVEDYYDEMIEIRRHLHMNPELSFEDDRNQKAFTYES
ncbi:Uncharacterised protein [Mammaliicoccus lentus]|nr:amidohydrolase [Mammaliicoccus lentus]SCU20480.1 Uncharacterised protein [Mammaliicoccus lentus]